MLDRNAHIGAIVTTDRTERLDVRLSYTEERHDGFSTFINVMLFRLDPQATSEDPNVRYIGLAESRRESSRNVIDLDDTGRLAAGTYLVVIHGIPSEDIPIRYSLSVSSERLFPCTRDGRILERGSVQARKSARETGQGYAYYSSMKAVEKALERDLAPARDRCGETVSLAEGRARLLSMWSKGDQWVTSIGLPELTFQHDVPDWTAVENDDVLAACTEVMSDSPYSRRFECTEEASFDWACCVL
jgi:hypothetical protein